MQKQENNILPEYQTLPPDSIAPEYPSLPDEYLQSKQPVEKGVPEHSESRKRKVMRILCMLAACVLLGRGVYGTEANQTKIPAQTTEEIQAPDENGENRDSRENDHVQSVTTETETEPVFGNIAQESDGTVQPGMVYGIYEYHDEYMDAAAEIGWNQEKGTEYIYLSGVSKDGRGAGEFSAI